MSRSLPLLVLLLALTGPVLGQTRFGVVWDPPQDDLEAEADLRAIRDMGFTAIRTGPLDDATLLGLADTLGLDVYQEIPVRLVSGPELRDSLVVIKSRLSRILASAEGHRSARNFGLVYAPASDRAETCESLADLVDFVRPRVAPGARIYYVTWLAARDVCAPVVDLVLLDDARHDQPVRLLETWGRESPVGLAAVGKAIDPTVGTGSVVPNSAEQQAAFLARILRELKGSRAQVVFLYRWQDPHARAKARFHPAPLGRMFGLQDESGRARPARDVAEGFLTRGQGVFGLPTGVAPTSGNGWFLLGGWLVITAIAILLALSARFRSMVPRYFLAHGFYRSAVQEGRDTAGYVTAGLLALLGVTIGLLGWYTASSLMDEAPVHALWFRSSAGVRAAMDSLAARELMLTLLAGSVGLVATITWMAAWSFAASRSGRLQSSQALMLAVWPRWPMLMLMLVAMLATTADEVAERRVAMVLAVTWLATALWSTARTGLDLGRVARIHPAVTLLLWLLSPAVLLIAAGVGLFLWRPDIARYYLALAGSAAW